MINGMKCRTSDMSKRLSGILDAKQWVEMALVSIMDSIARSVLHFPSLESVLYFQNWWSLQWRIQDFGQGGPVEF